MKAVALERLEKTFPDGTRAVAGIELAIEAGEFVVLLGPSGCGKTTTLRMIAGLETPSAGRIRLGDADVTTLRPAQRDVGFVFQFYALYPHLTVRENVAFPLACAGVGRRERRDRVDELAERLGLVALLDRLPRELSGGDQQRVALARAMVRRPSVWLMDEPLGTLDADLRAELVDFLRAQQLAERVTTVYVTHDQEEAMRLADRVVVMSGGTILQADTPARVYDEPADLFVARFVGSPGMNLVTGEVRASAGGAVFGAAGAELPLPGLGAVRAGAAVLGFRPEGLRLDPRGPLRGRVRTDEFLGASRCLHVDSPLGRLVARVAIESPASSGDEVALEVETSALRLFDSATGKRLR
jgi:multiple sugar transport system ATP-binding protein